MLELVPNVLLRVSSLLVPKGTSILDCPKEVISCLKKKRR